MNEIDRILALPRRALPSPPPERTARVAGRLRPVQVEMLAELEVAPPPRGLFAGDVGPGDGKTLPSLLASYVLNVRGEDTLLIVPSNLLRKTRRDLDTWRARFPEGEGHWPRMVSSAILSHKNHAEDLFAYAPRLVVIDEAQEFADPKSARAKRLVEYAVSRPDTRFVFLSGTLGGKSIERIHHLAELALRDGSFIPLDRSTRSTWSGVLNFDAQPSDDALAYLRPLLDWAGEKPPPPGPTTPFRKIAAPPSGALLEPYRRAYAQRRKTAPGVIASVGTETTASLNIGAWRTPIPDVLRDALKTLQTSWALPNGEELIEALDFTRHAMTLSLGFYHQLDWTRPIARGEADGPDLDAWKELRRAWGKALRTILEYRSIPGLDSPARVIDACKARRAPPDTIRAWDAWDEARGAFLPRRNTVWLSDEVVLRAWDNVTSWDNGILWYSSPCIGERLAALGVPVYGRGTDEPPERIRHAACSIITHGTGKNLQAWDRALVLQPPRGDEAWEQLLARQHRPGQTSDTVYVEVAEHTWAMRAAVHVARKRAKHAEDTTLRPQRLLYGTQV